MERIKSNYKRYIAYFVYAMLWTLIHFLCRRYGDDIVLQQTLVFSNFDEFWGYYTNYITYWSSRLIIDFFGTLIEIASINVWRVLDIAAWLLLTQQLEKIFNKDKNLSTTVFIMSCCFIYPFEHLGTAGWMATTFTYLWPIVFLLYNVNVWFKIINKEKVRKYEYVVSFFLYLYGIDHQQSAVVMTFFTVMLAVILIWKKQVSKYILGITALTITRLLVHMTWGGSNHRIDQEIGTWFPDFGTLSLFDKLQIGLSTTAHRVFLEGGLVFAIMGIVMAVVVFHKYEDMIHRTMAIVPNVFFLAWGPLRSLIEIYTPNVYMLDKGYSDYYGYINNENAGSLFSYVMLFLLGIAVICIIGCIISIYGNTEKSIIYSMVFIMGIASRTIMGFSPTIVASGNRTCVYLYFCCIILLIAFAKEIKGRQLKWCQTSVYILGALAFVHNMITAFYA